jgi:hypothetical protein
MSIEHVAAGMAGHAGTDWPWGWAAAAVLAVATVVAALQALHWRRRMQQQLQRDRHLKLALWASGEHFWDYDLQQRKLRRMRADEAVCATTSGNRCMSAKQVVPLVSMSAMASSVPSRTYSASTQRFSSGQTCVFNQGSSAVPSAAPRSSAMAAWV